MKNNLVAKAAVTINAPIAKVWDALINPKIIKQYLMGADIVTDWEEGSPILYKGIYQGRTYEDKGMVLRVIPEKLLIVTHWSPLSGTPDSPDNYHQVDYNLTPGEGGIRLSIAQDNNASSEEQEQNANFWQTALDTIKKLLEG